MQQLLLRRGKFKSDVTSTNLEQSCTVYCDAQSTCSGNGRCSSQGDCSCFTDYYGNQCQYKRCPSCVFGTCNKLTGVCECEKDYYGQTCDTYCVASTTCSGLGTCNPSSGKCMCSKDHYGSVRHSRYCSSTSN